MVTNNRLRSPTTVPIDVNVGGKVFTTSLATLIWGARQGSAVLAAIVTQLTGPHWREGDGLQTLELQQGELTDEVFIDRDPLPYQHILRYLRTGKIGQDVSDPSALVEEAEFLGLEGLAALAKGLPGMCRRDLLDLINRAKPLQLCETSLQNVNLGLFDLTGSNLSGFILRSANLRKTKLSNARLDACDLRGGNMEGACLEGSSLMNCDLSGADLAGCSLKGCNMKGANLEGCKLQGCSLEGADMTGCKLARADLRGAKLESCILASADLRGATGLEGASLERCDLRGSNLEGCSLEGCSLKGAQLEGSILAKVRLRGVTGLEGSSLMNCDLTKVDLAGCSLKRCNMKRCSIGFTFKKSSQDKLWRVSRIKEGGWAEQSKAVAPNDVLLHVGSKDVTKLTAQEISGLLLGKEGTNVDITLRKAGTGEVVKVTGTRLKCA